MKVNLGLLSALSLAIIAAILHLAGLLLTPAGLAVLGFEAVAMVVVVAIMYKHQRS